MAILKTSGTKKLRKQKTGADVPIRDATPSVDVNLKNIEQLANDIYTTPSLDGDTLPNLATPLETQITNLLALIAQQLVPIGSIIPHYDFDATVLPGTYWKYCDGNTISDGDSPLDGLTLPDLSAMLLPRIGRRAATSLVTMRTSGRV